MIYYSRDKDFVIIKFLGQLVRGMGGAMDLVTHPRTKVIVLMEHLSKSGAFKILDECNLPLTGKNCVDMIITELGVFKICMTKSSCCRQLILTEIAQGVSLEQVQDATGCHFTVDEESLKIMAQATTVVKKK